MSDRTIAAVSAGVLFVATVLVGLAGADKPPPPGFLLLVVSLAAVCTLAFTRIAHHLKRRAAGARGSGVRLALEGAAAGIVVMVALGITGPASGTPPMSMADRLIGIGVMAAGGALCALAAWGLAVLLQSARQRREKASSE